MVYLAIGLIGLLLGALTVVYVTRKPENPTDLALDSLQESHEREHEADAEIAKTADPVDYLNTGLGGLR